MADTTVTTEDKRNELREKIEAAEARNAERSFADYAADVKDGATQFVKDHPIATVAGGLAIGMLLAGMTKPGRRVRRRAGAQASSLWSTVTELAAAYGTGLLDTAETARQRGGDRWEDFRDSLSDSARSARRDARYRREAIGDTAHSLTRELGKKSSRALREFRNR